MGRHGSRHSRGLRLGRLRISLTAVSLCVLVLAMAGLGTWWWIGRSVTDPIDANPVSSTAVVVASEPCAQGGLTTVRISGVDADSQLDGCGFGAGQRVSVEYLAGHPDVVRLTGTTRAGDSSTARKIIPIAILIAGMAAAIGLVAAGRTGSRRPRRDAISVAQLRARIASNYPPGPAEPSEAGEPSVGEPGAGEPGVGEPGADTPDR